MLSISSENSVWGTIPRNSSIRGFVRNCSIIFRASTKPISNLNRNEVSWATTAKRTPSGSRVLCRKGLNRTTCDEFAGSETTCFAVSEVCSQMQSVPNIKGFLQSRSRAFSGDTSWHGSRASSNVWESRNTVVFWLCEKRRRSDELLARSVSIRQPEGPYDSLAQTGVGARYGNHVQIRIAPVCAQT